MSALDQINQGGTIYEIVPEIAELFKTTKAYHTGDHVIHEAGWYTFKADKSAGAWDATKVNGPFKVTDQLSDLKEDFTDIESIFKQSEAVDFSTAHSRIGLVNLSNVWSTSTGFYSYCFEITSGQYKTVTVTANDNLNAVVSLLASSTLTRNVAPTWASGYTGRQTVEAGETKTFAIPSDCVYIVLQKEAPAKDYTPAGMTFNAYKTIPDRDETLTISGDYPDSKVVGDRFELIDGYLFSTESIDVSDSHFFVVIGKSTGKWSTNTSYDSAIVPIGQKIKKIIVTANDENNATVALLKTTAHKNETVPDYATGCDSVSVSAGTTIEIAVPEDAKYLYCAKITTAGTFTPASITGAYLKTADAIPLGLHEFPPTESALNIVKRCRQMTDIKWTPAVDLPRLILTQSSNPPDTAERQYSKGTFKAGVEYKGIPYGRTNQTMTSYGHSYATIGNYIKLDTFISSVSNPKSKLSLDDVSSVSGHKSVIYASVCSGFACYALGVSEVATANIPSISGMSLIGKINDNGTLLNDALFKIGDVLNLQGDHVGVITDIIRDGDGVIQSVEISECTVSGLADKTYADGQIGGIARRKGWTRWNLFYERWKDYSLYRYSGTVTYTPSQYVNVGDEFDGYVVEHFPIMPYEGEGFAYKTGYIPNYAVKLVYTLSDYAYVKVFKDGTEISGSPFALTEGADSIDITEITAGEYSAYLCNITDGDVVNLTYPCHWSIT